MAVLRSIERPVTATLRSASMAASHTCCTRWMWLAKEATRTWPSASAIKSRKTLPTSASERVTPPARRWWNPRASGRRPAWRSERPPRSR